MQQNFAQSFAHRRAARFAGHYHPRAVGGEMLLQALPESLQVRGFARPVDAFKGNEFTARHLFAPDIFIYCTVMRVERIRKQAAAVAFGHKIQGVRLGWI